jgi:hypothetical protein
MNQQFYVVTDGSAMGNPGPGGWAAVLVSGRMQWEISGASFLDHDFRDGAYGGDSGTSFDSRRLQSKPVLRLRLPNSWDEVPRNPVEKPGMAKPARFATTASRVMAGVASTGERGAYSGFVVIAATDCRTAPEGPGKNWTKWTVSILAKPA